MACVACIVDSDDFVEHQLVDPRMRIHAMTRHRRFVHVATTDMGLHKWFAANAHKLLLQNSSENPL